MGMAFPLFKILNVEVPWFVAILWDVNKITLFQIVMQLIHLGTFQILSIFRQYTPNPLCGSWKIPPARLLAIDAICLSCRVPVVHTSRHRMSTDLRSSFGTVLLTVIAWIAVMLSPRGQAVLEAKILSSASASASKICPRLQSQPRAFVLGLSSNFLFWPHENVCNAGIGNFDSQYITNSITCLSSLMTNDNKDETLIYWSVCVVNIIILKVIFGLGKLASASASASWFWPQPRPRHRRFVLGLGLGDLSSASASRICPHLTSLLNRYSLEAWQRWLGSNQLNWIGVYIVPFIDFVSVCLWTA